MCQRNGSAEQQRVEKYSHNGRSQGHINVRVAEETKISINQRSQQDGVKLHYLF